MQLSADLGFVKRQRRQTVKWINFWVGSIYWMLNLFFFLFTSCPVSISVSFLLIWQRQDLPKLCILFYPIESCELFTSCAWIPLNTWGTILTGKKKSIWNQWRRKQIKLKFVVVVVVFFCIVYIRVICTDSFSCLCWVPTPTICIVWILWLLPSSHWEGKHVSHAWCEFLDFCHCGVRNCMPCRHCWVKLKVQTNPEQTVCLHHNRTLRSAALSFRQQCGLLFKAKLDRFFYTN